MTEDEFKTLKVGDKVRHNQTGEIVTVMTADIKYDWDAYNAAWDAWSAEHERGEESNIRADDFSFTWAVWFEETALNSRLGDDLRPLVKL